MDTLHAFAYGENIHVLAYRRHDEPTMEPDPELTNSCSTAAEAVERTFARIEERRRRNVLVAKRNRQDQRIWRQTPRSQRGEAVLDYNTALDIEWSLMQEDPNFVEAKRMREAFDAATPAQRATWPLLARPKEI